MRVRLSCRKGNLAIVTAAMLTACNGAGAASDGRSTVGAGGQNAPGRSAQTQSASGAPAGDKILVPTTTAPANDCDWIPVGEVEAIIGKLAAPAVQNGGCRYTLVMPDQIRALREKELRTFEAGKDDMSVLLAKKAKQTANPENYAMTLSLEWSGGVDIMKLTNEAIGKMFANDLADVGASPGSRSDTARAKAPTGWDDQGGVPYGFGGRIGHVRVTVQGETPDVPREPMARLAAAVRDRIPDLPFPVKNRYQVPMDVPPNADPCGLLTRAEAEAVLGPLVVNPYRSSSYFPPLAHPAGNSCAYFTAGHHVFVLGPTWTDGAKSFALEKGIGGLIGTVMPRAQVILKGPWDKSQITSKGTLDFLKNDRLLEVNFALSSTDRLGALKLATQAMQRLSAMSYEAMTKRTEVRPAPGAGGTAPGWSRVLKLSDGRTMVADGAFVLDAAIARPSALPRDEAPASSIERFMTANLPNEVALAQLIPGSRPRTYAGPDNVLFNADYVDYLRQTLPANRARIRMAAGRPAVILLDGKPVGLIMPLR